MSTPIPNATVANTTLRFDFSEFSWHNIIFHPSYWLFGVHGIGQKFLTLLIFVIWVDIDDNLYKNSLVRKVYN